MRHSALPCRLEPTGALREKLYPTALCFNCSTYAYLQMVKKHVLRSVFFIYYGGCLECLIFSKKLILSSGEIPVENCMD
jgi:hypothetical protein